MTGLCLLVLISTITALSRDLVSLCCQIVWRADVKRLLRSRHSYAIRILNHSAGGEMLNVYILPCRMKVGINCVSRGAGS